MSHSIGPPQCLPLPIEFTDDDSYVDELLAYAMNNDLLQLLTGGIHVLDFFTRDPDFFEWIFPKDWREWFAEIELCDIMDFVLRDDLTGIMEDHSERWRNHPKPPQSLLDYVWGVRRLLLRRTPQRLGGSEVMPYHVSVGMKVKKVHEVACFSQYLDHLAQAVENQQQRPITHLVDFGAGQNYLGRALANTPINRHIIAVESKSENVETARRMDRPAAKVASKGVGQAETSIDRPPSSKSLKSADTIKSTLSDSPPSESDISMSTSGIASPPLHRKTGSIQYVAKRLDGGDLTQIIDKIRHECDAEDHESPCADSPDPNLMVISLHSCGNLSHHGLRSLIANREVSVVAVVGCCYNLATERLTKPSDHNHPVVAGGRLLETAGDPLGFPMSERLCHYPARHGKSGVHLNLTTRMMAVQAPTNWTPAECDNFITRHFYRSLLEKVFLDHGIVKKPALKDPNYEGYVAGQSHVGYSAASSGSGPGPVIVVGKLSKAAYASFVRYARTALARLSKSGGDSKHDFQKLNDDINDNQLLQYEQKYGPRRKDLGILWTLMAYSAGLAEAIIVVDRWQWLREQHDVSECWVEPVFQYSASPRNLAVIGIKKVPNR